MTKRHFIQLADVIRAHNQNIHEREPFTPRQIDLLAKFCHRQNNSFKRVLWLDYIMGSCGPNGGKLKKAKAA